MTELESVRIFVKVVQLGSFSKAADLLRLPKSTVSRTISGLEQGTGTRLLARTTRSLTPTPAGRAFFERAAGSVQALEDSLRSLQGQDSVVAGSLRITAPEDLGAFVISPLVAKLSRRHPELQLELHYTDDVLDLVKGGYDFAIRIGALAPSRFKARKLGEVTVIPVAAPAYLAEKKRIRAPADLTAHDCLVYRPGSSRPKWTLRSGKTTVQVPIRPKIIANMMTSLMSMAKQGAGIAFVPHYLCRAELAAGELARVLPEWGEPGLAVHAVAPLGTGGSTRLKLVATELAAGLEKALR